MYILGFLFKQTGGTAIHNVQPKIIGGQAIDIKYRPFMVNFFLIIDMVYPFANIF